MGGEEIIIPTLAYHHLKSYLIPDSYRYLDWTNKIDSHPSWLIIKDAKELEESNAFFARKVDPNHSQDLIELYDKILKE